MCIVEFCFISFCDLVCVGLKSILVTRQARRLLLLLISTEVFAFFIRLHLTRHERYLQYAR